MRPALVNLTDFSQVKFPKTISLTNQKGMYSWQMKSYINPF